MGIREKYRLKKAGPSEKGWVANIKCVAGEEVFPITHKKHVYMYTNFAAGY